MIVNGDFAVDSNREGLAEGWEIEETRGLKIQPSLVAGPQGKRAQQLTVTPEAGEPERRHAMLLQQNTLTLRKGQWYRVTFQARGRLLGSTVSIAIRQTEPWADLGLSDQFRVHLEWQPHEFFFRARRTSPRTCAYRSGLPSRGSSPSPTYRSRRRRTRRDGGGWSRPCPRWRRRT